MKFSVILRTATLSYASLAVGQNVIAQTPPNTRAGLPPIVKPHSASSHMRHSASSPRGALPTNKTSVVPPLDLATSSEEQLPPVIQPKLPPIVPRNRAGNRTLPASPITGSSNGQDHSENAPPTGIAFDRSRTLEAGVSKIPEGFLESHWNSFTFENVAPPAPFGKAKTENEVLQASSVETTVLAPNQLRVLPLVPRSDGSATKDKIPTVEEMIHSPTDYVSLVNNLHGQTYKSDFSEGAIDLPYIRDGASEGYQWTPNGYCWVSPAFCHSPLYFEQPNYERYGQGKKRPFAPVYSAARFVGHAVTLPAAMFVNPPWCKTCTLGNNRPGDCAPVQRKPSPRSN